METSKLTVRLPKQDLEFAERYARARRITVSKLVDQLLRSLRNSEERARGRAAALRGASDALIRSEPARSEKDAWQELFRVGDALAADDPPGSPTMTATVLQLRR